MTRRTLVLRREALTELTTGDLTSVVGGQALTQSPAATCPLRWCVRISNDFTCVFCQSNHCETQFCA